MQGSQVGSKVEMADSVLKVVEIDVDLNVIATRENESAVGRNDFASQGNEPGTREIRSATARNEGYMKLNAFLIYTYSFFSRNGNMVLRYDTIDEICPKKLNILFYMLYI